MRFEFNENTPSDDVLIKLYQHENLTAAEKDSLFNYIKVPKVLRDLLSDDSLRYIDLVDDPEIINKLPHNPLDEGGKEYLAMSIRVANKINQDKALNTKEKDHLMKDIAAPLEFIFHGVDDENFQRVIKTLVEEPSEDAKKYLSKDQTERFIDKEFKNYFYSIVEGRSTDTFRNEVTKVLNKLEKNENELDETMALNFKGYPDKVLFHTTILSRDLPLLMEKDEEDPNQFYIKRRQDSKDRIGTITIDKIIEDSGISFFDLGHYIGICRLYDDGTDVFTPDMLVRATYSDSNKRVTDKQRNDAIKSVNKLMRTIIDIDVSEEYRDYNFIGKNENVTLGEVLLHARRRRVRHSNGSVTWGYKILSQPFLDVHAFNLGQVDRLDNEIVGVTGGREDLLLTNYLSIRLASLMSEKNKMSNVIRLDTLYKYIEIENPNRQKRAQIRNKIEGRLTEWKDKNIIKDSEFIKEGNKITKFKIVM